MTLSRTTTAVPGAPQPLLATSFLFQPLQIPIAIIPIPYEPLEASRSLSDRLSPSQDHQLCSRSTQFNPRYSLTIAVTPYHQLLSHITPKLPRTSIKLPDNSQQTGYSPPALFQTNHDLSWLIQTYYSNPADQRRDHPSLQNYHGSVCPIALLIPLFENGCKGIFIDVKNLFKVFYFFFENVVF